MKMLMIMMVANNFAYNSQLISHTCRLKRRSNYTPRHSEAAAA